MLKCCYVQRPRLTTQKMPGSDALHKHGTPGRHEPFWTRTSATSGHPGTPPSSHIFQITSLRHRFAFVIITSSFLLRRHTAFEPFYRPGVTSAWERPMLCELETLSRFQSGLKPREGDITTDRQDPGLDATHISGTGPYIRILDTGYNTFILL